MNVEKIIKRMMDAGNFKSLAALARGLGITPQALNSIKKRGNFPPKLILEFSQKHKLLVDYISTGEGPKHRETNHPRGRPISSGQIAQPQAEYKSVDPEVARLYSQVQRILKHGDTETVGKLKGFLAALDPGEKK